MRAVSVEGVLPLHSEEGNNSKIREQAPNEQGKTEACGLSTACGSSSSSSVYARGTSISFPSAKTTGRRGWEDNLPLFSKKIMHISNFNERTNQW